MYGVPGFNMFGAGGVLRVKGEFSDPKMRELTEEGSENQIPTYQYWHVEGKYGLLRYTYYIE